MGSNVGPRSWLNDRNRDYYGGALMILVGAGAIYKGLGYRIGSLTRMGPGYFPVMVGAVLILMGLIIAIGGGRKKRDAEAAEHHAPEWRGWLCIVLSTIAFLVLGKYGGLLPATFAVVFISALGDRENTLKSAFLLALGMMAIAVVVFSWALHMQFPLFTWG